MIRKSYPWLWLLAGVLTGLVVSNRLTLLAQDRGGAGRSSLERSPEGSGATRAGGLPGIDDSPPADPGPTPGTASSQVPSVHDVLLRPYRFPFSRPTSLLQVCAHLKQTLKIPVVLDLAALGRQDVEPEDPVQLELAEVRLKTGLKLLLDQAGLTYHVVAEDNLLIITDREGSEDPLDRVWSELRALHRDLHDVQDAVDELTELIGGEKGEEPRVRKPTIIEEMPEKEGEQPAGAAEQPAGPGRKPNGAIAPAPRPAPAPRSTSSHIPLRGA